MPRKKSDRAILAEIREVIKDFETGFRVTNYSEPELGKGSDNLTETVAFNIIHDLANGTTKDLLTKDYRKTKREARKKAPRTPAP